jgi:hypothetical protein
MGSCQVQNESFALNLQPKIKAILETLKYAFSLKPKSDCKMLFSHLSHFNSSLIFQDLYYAQR